LPADTGAALRDWATGLAVSTPVELQEPIRIFETFYWDAEKEKGSGKHNRYLYVGGFPPVLLTREPSIIRAVLAATGDKPGQFDRDTSPTAGIARATGKDSLLYANGSVWRRQKTLSVEPFGRSNLFQPEKFHGLSRPSARRLQRDLKPFVAASKPPARRRSGSSSNRRSKS
jgi:hypothetical protein